MRYLKLAQRFDRMSRHSLLPIGAALIISVATFGLYSRFTGNPDVLATPSASPDTPAVHRTGVGTIAVDGDATMGGSMAPAVVRGIASYPGSESRGQSTPRQSIGASISTDAAPLPPKEATPRLP